MGWGARPLREGGQLHDWINLGGFPFLFLFFFLLFPFSPSPHLEKDDPAEGNPFVCDIPGCSHRYSNLSNMRRHQRIKHGRKGCWKSLPHTEPVQREPQGVDEVVLGEMQHCGGPAAETVPAQVKMLVVDDKPTSRRVAVRFLERAGYNVLQGAFLFSFSALPLSCLSL